ncbi:hypothetical protein IHE44_0009084 [Lamprotornis superbus]|uniref:Potassium channel domain-containing protein n=1 Tax=Lamprotornis superbus TaxID=245042 RepID=A0A835U0X0_9PASS|nr:hypothetical protein IHE44_0009084 [Lamprotornis superbus]
MSCFNFDLVVETVKWQRQPQRLVHLAPCAGPGRIASMIQLGTLESKRAVRIVSEAAEQGVAITGNNTFNNWNWPNAVIFAATVITTIGYGNVSPKTHAGRLFCIFYGLFGVPLCLTWISALGKFFGGRAKRLGQFLTKRGVSLRKAQITCTAIFIVWGVLVHLVIPPFVFMITEGWNYIEGLYFSFITITTIGFGDFVAGVNPDANYHALYRYFVELWIYLGLAWLSLFVNWKVSMFVEVHKAIKKRRKKRKESFDNHPRSKKPLQMGTSKDVNIFSFLSKKEETYNDLIKQIGKKALKTSNDKMIIVENAKQMNASIDVQVTYTKTESFEYDEASLDIQNGHVLRPLHDKRIGDSPLEGTMFVNQLDRISEEEGEVWDSRDYRPLIFENANITFVNEDDDEEEDISDDEETSKSSMDDNLAEESETAKKLNSLDLHLDWAFSAYPAWFYWLTVGCGFIPEEKGEVMDHEVFNILLLLYIHHLLSRETVVLLPSGSDQNLAWKKQQRSTALGYGYAHYHQASLQKRSEAFAQTCEALAIKLVRTEQGAMPADEHHGLGEGLGLSSVKTLSALFQKKKPTTHNIPTVFLFALQRNKLIVERKSDTRRDIINNMNKSLERYELTFDLQSTIHSKAILKFPFEKDLLVSKLVVSDLYKRRASGLSPPAQQQQQQQPEPGCARQIAGRRMEEPCKALGSQQRLSATTYQDRRTRKHRTTGKGINSLVNLVAQIMAYEATVKRNTETLVKFDCRKNPGRRCGCVKLAANCR